MARCQKHDEEHRKAQESAEAEMIIEKFANTPGPISDALKAGAARIAKGDDIPSCLEEHLAYNSGMRCVQDTLCQIASKPQNKVNKINIVRKK